MHHENWHQAGWNLFYAKRYDKAIEMANDRLAFDPDDWNAWVLRANCFLNLDDSKNLGNAAQRLIEIDPGSDVGYYLISASLIDENASKALEFIEKALEIDPERPRNYATKGLLLRLLGFDKDAQETISAGLKLDPNNTALLREQSIIFDIQENPLAASLVMDNALKEEPNSYDNYLYDAIVSHDWGNSERALASIKEALRLNPESKEARELYPEILKGSRKTLGLVTKFSQLRLDWNRMNPARLLLFLLPFTWPYLFVIVLLLVFSWYMDFLKNMVFLANKKRRAYLLSSQLLSFKVNTVSIGLALVMFLLYNKLDMSLLVTMGLVFAAIPVLSRIWLVEAQEVYAKWVFGGIVLAAVLACLIFPVGLIVVLLVFGLIILYSLNLFHL